MGTVSEREMSDLDAVAEFPSFVDRLPAPGAALSPNSSVMLRSLVDQKESLCRGIFCGFSWEDLQNSDTLNRASSLYMPTKEDLSDFSEDEKKIAVRVLGLFVRNLYRATVKDYWRQDFQSETAPKSDIGPYLLGQISSQIQSFTGIDLWPCLFVHSAFNFMNHCRNLGADANRSRHTDFRESVQIALVDSLTGDHVSLEGCRDLLKQESREAWVAVVWDSLYARNNPIFDDNRFFNGSALLFLERLLQLPADSLTLFPDFDY